MDAIRFSKRGSIATVELNRANKRNALTDAMLDALLVALETIEADESVRVLVLSAAGDTFCAGVDLAEMLAHREASGVVDHTRLQQVFLALDALRCPTVASVQGQALAGGCELALHCDLRIVSPEARFGMPLARLGIAVPLVLAQRLTDSFGVSVAKDLLFTAEPLSGERAYQLGVATRLVSRDALALETQRVADRIAANAPLAVQEMKRTIRRTVRSTEPMTDQRHEAARVRVSRSQDVQEGLSAFLERREPVFRGL